MSNHRLNITVSPETFELLQASAEHHDKTPTTIAGELVRAAATGLPEPAAAAPDGQRPQWLGKSDGWKDSIWAAGQRLLTWYPDLAEVLPEGWVNDRFSRDGIFSLVVWRSQIDAGQHGNDPLAEHRFLTTLHAFRRTLEERRGYVGTERTAETRPADW